MRRTVVDMNVVRSVREPTITRHVSLAFIGTVKISEDHMWYCIAAALGNRRPHLYGNTSCNMEEIPDVVQLCQTLRYLTIVSVQSQRAR